MSISNRIQTAGVDETREIEQYFNSTCLIQSEHYGNYLQNITEQKLKAKNKYINKITVTK